ncbi:uncharacterized protein LOC125333098 isoform X2 [Corvus hawaiiensis]|uniref:uncharacterized protein LOC125333098 isoform X2 n=1 Tax=Corvus hawaiiensis TaxID=134902 RepID=UPI002018EB62|nr:uncharacterized protein LOC125333098 isoform X2 [Corvus hawaiiensis]
MGLLSYHLNDTNCWRTALGDSRASLPVTTELPAVGSSEAGEARQQEQAEGTRASHKERENQIVRWRHFTSRSDTVALARLREAGMSAGCVVQLSLRLPCAAVGEFLQEALLKLGLIWREKRGQDNKKLAEEEPGHEEGSVLVGLKLHLRSHESPQITHKWPRSLKADGHHADSTSPICAVQC